MVLSKNLLLLEKISRKGRQYIIYAEALYPKNVAAGLKLRPKVRKEEGGLTTEMGSDYGHSVLNM